MRESMCARSALALRREGEGPLPYLANFSCFSSGVTLRGRYVSPFGPSMPSMRVVLPLQRDRVVQRVIKGVEASRRPDAGLLRLSKFDRPVHHFCPAPSTIRQGVQDACCVSSLLGAQRDPACAATGRPVADNVRRKLMTKAFILSTALPRR